MRSGEIAKLAGVTPRTLRHYRSIGLLPEPPRDENDYCNYQIGDLLRLLRIKNLKSLGFSLEKIGELLSEEDSVSPENSTDYLDALDQEIATEIERLKEQRKTIALLKKSRVSADTPAGLVDVMSLLLNQDLPPALVSQERDALLILEHCSDELDFDYLSQFYTAIVDHEFFDRYRELGIRAFNLEEDATEEEREELAQEGADILMVLLDDLNISADSPEEQEPNLLLKMYEDEGFTPVQRDIYDRLLKIIDNRNQKPK